MLFKNARLFRFTKPFHIEPEKLESDLQSDKFKPCGPQEVSRQGWVSPTGRGGEHLVFVSGGCMLICLQHQEKILPSSVIKEIVEERCEVLETEQNRKVRRKERVEIAEQVTLEMLPHAFHRNRRIYAYLSLKDGLMVVDSSSSRAAEDCASALRRSIGSLPIRPPVVKQAPAFTFTGWLNESITLPDSVVLGSDCWLEDPTEDGGKITAKGLDLKSDEVRNHIDAGMQVTRLAVEWDGNLTFALDADMSITRLRFGDNFHDQLQDVDADDAMARFDASFALMTLEISRMVPGLLEALGGEDHSALVSDADTEKATLAPRQEAREVAPTTNDHPVKDDVDSLYKEAEAFVIEQQKASTSAIQRRFKVGYNRAAHLVTRLEEQGVISAANHDGARNVLKSNPAAA